MAKKKEQNKTKTQYHICEFLSQSKRIKKKMSGHLKNQQKRWWNLELFKQKSKRMVMIRVLFPF